MNDPKRHHWWPQLQSGYWCASDGCINVTDKDGKTFRTTPLNVGLEGHLYTRVNPGGEQDVEIEKWLSEKIDGPFDQIFAGAFDISNPRRVRHRGDPQKITDLKDLGLKLGTHVEHIPLSKENRTIIANYVAALLVRNPRYIDKLVAFHKENNPTLDEDLRKTAALENILHLYEVYQPVIEKSEFLLTAADGTHEFLFPDSGIIAQEPWRKHIPFDIHVPLTPTLSLQVVPFPDPVMQTIMTIFRANNQGVRRYNRAAISTAQRFVFSSGAPPADFIKRYLGVPAAKSIGFRFRNGVFETKFDRSRDFR